MLAKIVSPPIAAHQALGDDLAAAAVPRVELRFSEDRRRAVEGGDVANDEQDHHERHDAARHAARARRPGRSGSHTRAPAESRSASGTDGRTGRPRTAGRPRRTGPTERAAPRPVASRSAAKARTATAAMARRTSQTPPRSRVPSNSFSETTGQVSLELDVGHEEAAGHEPFAPVTRLRTTKNRAAPRGYRASCQNAIARPRIGAPRRRRAISGQRHQRADDRPRLVAREARRDHPPARLGGTSSASLVAHSVSRQAHISVVREEQRLGHRRALQVEHVGVGDEQDDRGHGPGARAGEPHDRRGDAGGAETEREHGDRDGRRAGPIEGSRAARAAC